MNRISKKKLIDLIYMSDYCPRYSCNATTKMDCKNCAKEALERYEQHIIEKYRRKSNESNTSC